MRLINNRRVRTVARHFSLAFSALAAGLTIGIAVEMYGKIDAHEEAKREAHLRHLAFVESEIVCTTNVTHHEARGEIVGAREQVAKVVLASVNDPSFSSKSVCEDAKKKGRFSALKHADIPRFEDPEWFAIYRLVNGVYHGNRRLPRGWSCVRYFRASDDYLEKLGGKQLAQLGFTMDAKGLKFFAAATVPVGTVGRITFYAPRGGCTHPSETA